MDREGQFCHGSSPPHVKWGLWWVVTLLSGPFWLLGLAQSLSSVQYMFDGIPGPGMDQVVVNGAVFFLILVALGGPTLVAFGRTRRRAQMTLTVSSFLMLLVSIPVFVTLAIVARETLAH